MSVTMPEPAAPPFVNNLGALTAIPVYTDPKVPAGTATLDHDPQDPRHITGIRAASDVVLTAEQIEQVRDHYRAMRERAGHALADWARLTQTITGGPASEAARWSTSEEWRVTGNPGGSYPPYEFTWSPLRNPHLGDPERGAREFIAAIESVGGTWDEGPHLSRRTVTVTDWEEADHEVANDPKADLRQLLADKLLARWVAEAHNMTVEDPPYEGQCEQIAGWVADMFTVDEDHQLTEDRRLASPTETTIRHRRLIAKTAWQPATIEPTERKP